MARVRRPIFKVLYAGKNITEDISKYLISLTYTDKAHGESDEIDIQLENSDGRWLDAWIPEEGDKLEVEIGYEGLLVNCGTFTIDEIASSGPPDVINLRALAVSINDKLRTKKSTAFEKQTLRQIAEAVAAANGLTLLDGSLKKEKITINLDFEKTTLKNTAALIREAIRRNSQDYYNRVTIPGYIDLKKAALGMEQKGKRTEAMYIYQTMNVARAVVFGSGIEDYRAARTYALNFAAKLEEIASGFENKNFTRTTSALDGVRIDRTTQNRETDLAFLKRVGEMYGFLFSVRDTNLIFIHFSDIEKAEPAQSIDVKNLISYSFKKTTDQTYSKASVKHFNPAKKETVEHEVEAGDDDDSLGFAQRVKADTLELRKKVEDKKQAEMMAKAALHSKNSKQQTGDFTLIGDPMLVAGNNFELTGLGKMSGIWTITESKHTIDRGGGYTTSVQTKKIDKPTSDVGAAAQTPQQSTGFCAEKSCFADAAAKLRAAAAKNDPATYKALADPIYIQLHKCATSLIDKGNYTDGNYVLQKIRAAKEYANSGYRYQMEGVRRASLLFASDLEKLSKKLKC